MDDTDFVLGPIEDVDQGVKTYLKHHWRFYLPLALICLAASILFAYYTGGGDVSYISFGILFIAYFLVRERVKHAFMRQFAKANSFSYWPSWQLSSLYGQLFVKGGSRSMTDVVSGVRGGKKVRFFYYHYSQGHGKNKRTYYYTVAEIEYGGELPDILVEKKDGFVWSSLAQPHQKALRLGGAFNDHFAVYVPEDFEVETFEIFTPEIMEQLINRAKSFSFEFINKRLYIFTGHFISKKVELEDLLGLTKYLIDVLGPRLARLHGDVAAMKGVYAKNYS